MLPFESIMRRYTSVGKLRCITEAMELYSDDVSTLREITTRTVPIRERLELRSPL